MKNLFLATSLAAGILLPNILYAEIRNPYVVDEKPQVIFGDSAAIYDGNNTYLGLENYAASYANHYLRVTFTYTHSRCCFASYPPRLYITGLDPRSTTSPLVKSNREVYPLLPIPVPPGHETDWYLYEVQLDATGYSVRVLRHGSLEVANFHQNVAAIADGDWVALANLYPMYATHDGSILNLSMAFAPMPVRDDAVPPEPELPDPVIIIPGIMGSAYKNGELVIDPILHTYDDLIATLKANGYEEGKDLFLFPYEWRDSNVFTANLLDEKISQVKGVCGCNKVDIVAHSMGGLVTRAYIQSADYDGDVDQLIFLGTPHKGAPTSYLQWEAGKFSPDFNSILRETFFIAESRKNGYSNVFNYIRQRPILSVQELLPTFNYLKDKNTGLLRNYPSNYPRNVFLESLNNNISNLANSGVRVTNITGDSGENKTIEVIRVIPTDHAVFWEHGEPEGFGAVIGDNGLERGVGDNTVTSGGSHLDGFASEEIAASHNRIPTVAANRVVRIMTGKDSVSSIDTGAHLDSKVLLLQLLSPIDAVVTAPDGRRVGKNFATGSEYNEIPGAFYSGFETDSEYISILNPLDGEYRVELQGTGMGGEYGLLTSFVSEGVAATTHETGLTEPGQVTTLHVPLDSENPNPAPEKIITSEVLLNDILKSYELGWITDAKFKDKLVRMAKGIIRTDSGGRSVDKKAARMLLVELKGYQGGKMNEQAYNIIKEDLDWLIAN